MSIGNSGTTIGGELSHFKQAPGSFIDAQALAYYNRVIADGGIVPAGFYAVNAYFKAVKAARGQSDINNCFLSQYWAGFGIKTAAGVGATAGGRACEKLYNLIGTTNDAEQTSAANQPLALVHTGENYFFGSGVGGNFVSTPNAVANQITGDIEINCKCNLRSYTSFSVLFAKASTAGNRAYRVGVISNTLYFEFTQDGTNFLSYQSSSIAALPLNTDFHFRYTRNSTTGLVSFFYSSDGTNYIAIGTVSGATGAAFNTTNQVEIGSWNNGGGSLVQGIIYRLTISNTIGGAPVVDFNPNNYNRATSQTTWTSTTGEVWTLNTPETNNALKAAIVDQTMIMGNGTSYGLKAANLNINQTAITSYTAFRKFVNTSGGQILKELGANYAAAAGFAYSINNFTANAENFGINANVGLYVSNYTETNLGLKLAAAVNNISNANEASPLLINNVASTFLSAPLSNNNTAAMNATGYNLLARNNAASFWANAILVGDSICAGEDSAGVQTAMWDIYKSLMKIA